MVYIGNNINYKHIKSNQQYIHPNKGLGSYQGIGIIVVNNIHIKPSYKYTNTPCMIAIHSSLEVLRGMTFETVKNRYNDQSKLFDHLFDTVLELGLTCLLPRKNMFKGLLTIKLEDSNDFISYCSNDIVVYPGKNDLENSYFQISLYGLDANDDGIELFIAYLKSYVSFLEVCDLS